MIRATSPAACNILGGPSLPTFERREVEPPSFFVECVHSKQSDKRPQIRSSNSRSLRVKIPKLHAQETVIAINILNLKEHTSSYQIMPKAL